MPRFFWLAGLVLLVPLLLGGCGATQAHRDSSTPTPTLTPTPSVNILLDGDGPDLSDPSSWCGPLFPLIADATISGLGPSHWNTPDHSPPPSLDAQSIIAGGYGIVTPIHFSQMKPLVDHRTQPTKEFMLAGGQVGPVKMVAENAPHLSVGKRYVLLFEAAIDRQAHAFTETRLQVVAAAFVKNEAGLATIQQEIAACK